MPRPLDRKVVPMEERDPAPKRGRMGPAKVAGWALCAIVAAFGFGAVALDAQPGTAAAESQQQAQVQDRQQAQDQGQVVGSQQQAQSDGGKVSADSKANGEGSASDEGKAAVSGAASSKASSSASQKADPGSSGSSSSASSSKPATSKPSHTHKWIHHAAVTKSEPIYETQGFAVCNACGAVEPGSAHIKQHVKNGEIGGTHTEYKKVQVGTKTVTVKKEYWSCSCGATK